MRTIEYTRQFKRDYKRSILGSHKAMLEKKFIEILQSLANDQPLAEQHRDHALIGEWSDHRDCHIKPDVVLIYRKPDMHRLQLVHIQSLV